MSPARTILHLDGERGFRGGERQLLYLASALRARGFENVIACRYGRGLDLEARRLGFETLPVPWFCEWDPITAVGVIRRARRARRPILHAHTAHAASIAAMGAAAGLSAVVHRRVDFELEGALSRRFKYAPAARVVAVSEAIARVLRGCGLPAAAVKVVHDAIPVGARECGWAGLPPERFAPPSSAEKAALRTALAAELGLDPALTWIGNAAALVPHKDHDTLIAAALLLLARRPRCAVLIAGQGPEQARLLRQIERTGLEGKVVLAGHREEPADFLKSLDLFALSSWGEGMGSVLLEAAACGLPIAATAAGGIPEIIEDGRTGLLAPSRDPEALAAALERLLDEPALAARLASAGREGLGRFSLSRMAARIEEVYDAVA